MALPTPAAARGLPTGVQMPDGMPTRIYFANLPGFHFWEKEVQPIGVDGGEPLDITNMLNVLYRTKAPNYLIDIPDISVTCYYKTQTIAEAGSSQNVVGIINQPTTITIFMPDHGTIAFYGYLAKFIPGTGKEKEVPTAQMTIVCTNWDPANCVEAGPYITIGSVCYSGSNPNG